jgi:predicted RNA-binding protein YlqC (UPF0109 family)
VGESWWWFVFAVPWLVLVIVAIVRLSRRPRRRPSRPVRPVRPTEAPRGAPASVPIRYTRHAQERMDERGVWSGEIDAVLRTPARMERDRAEKSVRLEGDFEGRVLKVWVAEPWPPQDEVVVKSTAWNYVHEMAIHPSAVGRVIGAKGATVKGIRSTTGAQISVNGDGTVRISGDTPEAVAEAARRVEIVAVAPR